MAQSCLETRPIPVCFTAADGTKQSLVGHIVYEGAKPIGVAYTTADDPETIIDITGGTITSGACPVPSPDVEWDILCDKQKDGSVVNFICRTVTSFDAACQPIDPVQADYFELDKVTPYEPTGIVGDCEIDCPVVGSLGTITDWATLAKAAG